MKIIRLIVECGNTGQVILNKLVNFKNEAALRNTLHPSQYNKRVGRLNFDKFGVAQYLVYR